MIIAYLGRNVKDYHKKYLWYLGKLKLICPVCGKNTEFHDKYKRHIHIGEEVFWIVIQRVICLGCGKTHAIIPDFLKPYKHYTAVEVEFVLRDLEDGVIAEQVESPASISTINRWFREFKEKGPQAAGALRALLKRLFNIHINEIKFTGINIFKTLGHILHEFPEIESSNLVIGDANQWLTNKMAGIYV